MPQLSGKRRRAQLKLRRAAKRGDVDARTVPTPHTPTARSPRSLESQFVKLDRAFLDDTRALAASIVLARPIPSDVAVLARESFQPALLSVPRRPRWRYEMSKEELDANERAFFRTWLAQQDAAVEQWQRALNDRTVSDDLARHSESHQMPHPPTHFERNIEVWRQFWRVTEISQILLVLLDSRCPPLHLPPSLAAYLSIPSCDPTPPPKHSFKSNTPRVILVLTKVDISGPARTAGWTCFLNANHPGVPVVPVEAYAPKSTPTVDQGPVRYEPQLPETFRERLVQTIRDLHEQLLQPPHWVTTPRAGESEEQRLHRINQWKPRVKRVIDWDRVLNAKGKLVGKAVGGVAVPKGHEVANKAEGSDNDQRDDAEVLDNEGEHTGDAYEWKEPEFLTVGVVGQPNVGKSSLLNAIFGKTRVRASRTPGKTKHFQTLFWTSDVRLVDCPGLVVPSFVQMDIQVLSGVLPISRVSAVPFCVHQLAQVLPLEQILELTHPSLSTLPVPISTSENSTPPRSSKSTQVSNAILVEDKRTWRTGQRPPEQTEVRSTPRWTANDIMIAYAEKKGWVTAKAGRPDIHRAGNAILRLVAEGKIPWGFWPPGSSVSDGLWLRDGMRQHTLDELETREDRDEGDSDEEGSMEELSSDGEDARAETTIMGDELDEDEDEDEEKPAIRGGNVGRFGALRIE